MSDLVPDDPLRRWSAPGLGSAAKLVLGSVRLWWTAAGVSCWSGLSSSPGVVGSKPSFGLVEGLTHVGRGQGQSLTTALTSLSHGQPIAVAVA